MKKKYIITLCLLAIALLSLLTMANIRPAPAHAQGSRPPSFVATDDPPNQNTCDGTDQPCTLADSTDQQIASTQGVTDNPPAGDPQNVAADKNQKPQGFTQTHECQTVGISSQEAHDRCKAALNLQIQAYRVLYKLDHCSPYTFSITSNVSTEGYTFYTAEGETTCLYYK